MSTGSWSDNNAPLPPPGEGRGRTHETIAAVNKCVISLLALVTLVHVALVPMGAQSTRLRRVTFPVVAARMK